MSLKQKETEMITKIINADDMGISPGVNRAIIVGFEQGILNSTSLMMNVAYTNQAVNLLLKHPKLAVGVHLNLTNQRNQRCLSFPSEIPLLADNKGHLKHGFLKLFLLSLLFPKAFSEQAEKEIRAQIEKALMMGLCLTHLDSHRHVHMIPALFRVTSQLAKEYKIKRVRVVNERFFKTITKTHNIKCLIDGGIIKLLILRFFKFINNADSDTYFYGVLHTTRLFGKNVRCIKIPKKYQSVEIGLHPSDTRLDKSAFEPAFYDYLLDKEDRFKEFETALDIHLLDRIGY